MTLEAPSIPRNNTPEDKLEAQQSPVLRNELRVPERPATAEPAQPYLTGNWEITETLENGLTRISDNSGDIATYRDLTAEELNDYIATDQEAEAARAAARAEKLAEQDPISDDERREDLANLYQYLAETTPTEEVATEAKSSFGRKVLRYFTERDPETGEFSYGSGALTRSGRAGRSEQATASATEIQQLTPELSTEQVTETVNQREKITSRISRGVQAAKNKLFRRSSSEEKQLGRTEKSVSKIDKKAEKLQAKLDKISGRRDDKNAQADLLRKSIATKESQKQEALKIQIASDHKEAIEMDIVRDEKIEAGRLAIYEAAKLRSRQLLDEAIELSEVLNAQAKEDADNFKPEDEATKTRKRFARAIKTKLAA